MIEQTRNAVNGNYSTLKSVQYRQEGMTGLLGCMRASESTKDHSNHHVVELVVLYY